MRGGGGELWEFNGGGGEGRAYSLVACLIHLTIDHASLSRRSTVGLDVLISCVAAVLKAIDPRTLCNAGTEHAAFYRLGRHGVHQARSAMRCLASINMGELHLTESHL